VTRYHCYVEQLPQHVSASVLLVLAMIGILLIPRTEIELIGVLYSNLGSARCAGFLAFMIVLDGAIEIAWT
jgi:hypothetical protein